MLVIFSLLLLNYELYTNIILFIDKNGNACDIFFVVA